MKRGDNKPKYRCSWNDDKAVRIDLTKWSTYSTFCIIKYDQKLTSRDKCSTTHHSSHPTLKQPVNGLRSIIHNRQTTVLRNPSGPPDVQVNLGRFVFAANGYKVY